MIYKLSMNRKKDWKAFILLIDMTEEESVTLLSNLNTLRKYIDFPKPKLELTDSSLPGMSCPSARKFLAMQIGCSELPRGE